MIDGSVVRRWTTIATDQLTRYRQRRPKTPAAGCRRARVTTTRPSQVARIAVAPCATISSSAAVITRRSAGLIAERRANPLDILALTLTARAAAEMTERVAQLVPYGFTDTV